jgi:predicted component of type VI protein secretion system
MRLKIHLILFTIAAPLLAAASAPPPLTPAAAEAMLDRYGPPGAAWPRFDALRGSILDGVESGDAPADCRQAKRAR